MINRDFVNIRPDVGVLSVLRHLNYKPWFAIAEFVDNSVQSFLSNRNELKHVDGTTTLKIEIELNADESGRLIVRDNAAGIDQANYPRAFRPAALPLDRSGLSEFGMGMKSAACWFSPWWSVRTSALGELVEKTVTFDIRKIVQDNLEELTIRSQTSLSNTHFTEIVLTNLYRIPKKRTINKIKTHLASIYRIFIRDGLLELYYNGDKLSYIPPNILEAPFYTGTPSESQVWRKELDFDFGMGLRAHGFAAIREQGSTSEAGFALFRRNRLIEGSGDETYRPEYIFKKPNSFIYQRLFGELHLEGFEVSHTKDGFQWDENEQPFLDLLKEHLDSQPLPLLEQAKYYRVREKTKNLKLGSETSVRRTGQSLQRHIAPIIEKQLVGTPVLQDPPFEELPPTKDTITNRKIKIEVSGEKWEIDIEQSNDPAVGDWVSYSDLKREEDTRKIAIRVSLAHPFMIQFGGRNPAQIEPLLRLAVAIILAQITAREAGVKLTDTFRRNINEILKDALSKP